MNREGGRRPLSLLFITCLLIIIVFTLSQCFHKDSNDPRGDLYAGAQACTSCHKDIASAHRHGNHANTSARSSQSLPPQIAPFYFADSSYILIEKRDGKSFQSHFADGAPTQSESFDIAFGSGEKARTYGWWKDRQLFELPLSCYHPENPTAIAQAPALWANSPGFSANHANFSRPILSRCFECHASYVKKEMVQTGSLSVSENLDSNSIIFGIDCERCHGPALEHVRFQQDNPRVTTARYIKSIRTMTRQQQLDLCAVCHSGNELSVKRSLFDFIPGDTLADFYMPDFGGVAASEPDVHGQQLQLLQHSRCFQKSAMTCNSCHAAHEPGAGIQPFINRCMTCHPSPKHSPNLSALTNNCIDCHMPLQTSKIIRFNNGAGGHNIPYLIRTHRIAVYITDQSHQK